MKANIKKKYPSKVTIVVVLILILFWTASSFLLFDKVSFSVVTYQTKNNYKSYENSTELFDDKIFIGEFNAHDNNLGLIILSLGEYKKPKNYNGEILKFRLREKGSDEWNFEQNYKLDLFDSQSSFMFGIPAVSDSKNKSYQFELSSNVEDNINHVKLRDPGLFITGYQYPKSEILGGDINSAKFAYSKLVGSFTDPKFTISALLYLIPFIFVFGIYLLIKRIPLKKLLNKNFNRDHLKMLFLITLIILFPNYFYFDFTFLVITLWIGAFIIYKFKSNASFILSLVLILLWLSTIPFRILFNRTSSDKVCNSNIMCWCTLFWHLEFSNYY